MINLMPLFSLSVVFIALHSIYFNAKLLATYYMIFFFHCLSCSNASGNKRTAKSLLVSGRTSWIECLRSCLNTFVQYNSDGKL